MLGRIHFVYAQGSVATYHVASTALLSHSVSHEKCLVWLLCSKPIIYQKRYKKDMDNCGYLHSINSLSWRLALGTSEVLCGRLGKAISSQWTICHRVLLITARLQIRHHVCYPRLRCRLSSLFLDLVHLLEVLLGGWIQSLTSKSFLCL